MTVTLPGGVLSGTVAAPVSKSDLHRILICAAFADKATTVRTGEVPDDIGATVRCLCALGARITAIDGGIAVEPVVTPPSQAILHVGESGSTLRFLVPVAAALGVRADFVMEGRLPERPMGPLIETLSAHGAVISRPERDTLRVGGKITGDVFTVRPDVSSQFVSGLLFAASVLGGGTVCFEGKAASAGYVGMTLSTLSRFGVRFETGDDRVTVLPSKLSSPGAVTAEGDWSAAAYWLCAGALSPDGVRVTGIGPDTSQGDRAIITILENMGAQVACQNGECCVKRGELRGVTVDATDIPDLVPPVAALAALADGKTVICGASRLRLKESDRLAALTAALSSLGADIKETGDGLIIQGKITLPGGTADSFGDHRIAMAAALASIRSGGVTVTGAEAVSKSYPGFWRDYKKLGGRVIK